MAFFDEREQSQRPAGRRSRRRPASNRGDRRQLMIRRGAAAAGILLLVILLVLGIRGCVSSARDDSLRTYNQNVSEIVRESDTQVATPLVETLSEGANSDPIELQTQVNQLRVTADEQLERTRGLSTPGAMEDAQSDFLLVMELRANAVGRIAQQIPAAYASEGADVAIRRIAGQMQAFLTSDVIYSQRVVPEIDRVLADAGIGGQEIAVSRTLPDLDWLAPETVAQRMGASYAGADGGRREDREPAPGPHGTILQSVSFGGTELVPGAPNEIPAGTDPVITLAFLNDDNEEFDVTGRVEVTGGPQPITAEQTLPRIEPNAEETIEITLPETPPAGTPVELMAEIEPVPGEEIEENNVLTFEVTFTE